MSLPVIHTTAVRSEFNLYRLRLLKQELNADRLEPSVGILFPGLCQVPTLAGLFECFDIGYPV